MTECTKCNKQSEVRTAVSSDNLNVIDHFLCHDCWIKYMGWPPIDKERVEYEIKTGRY